MVLVLFILAEVSGYGAVCILADFSFDEEL